MIAEAGAAIGGIKVAMDMAKGISALKSEAEINQAIIDIQRTLLDAQTAALEDKETISLLRDKIAKLQTEVELKQDWTETASKYELASTEMGAFVYKLKPDAANGEPSHRLCVTCFENGKKSILHGITQLACNLCGSKIMGRNPYSSVTFSPA